MLGCLFLVLPFCILLFTVSLEYVSISWSVREGSRETSGIQGVYLLKSVILVFAVQVGLQAVSGAIKNATLAFAKPQEASQ
jgi:TRAP-type mannitol/chloroaromatic compound transport system permease small subunit